MAGTISFDGLATGIKTSDTVDKLIEVESRPRILKEAEKARLENELSAWQEANTKLLALRDKTREIWNSSSWDSVKVTSSNSSVLTATATTSAQLGTYSFSVEKLAQIGQKSSKQFDAATSTVADGTLTLNVGDKTVNIDVTSSNNTLSAIAAAINNADIDASASVIKDGTKYRLLLSSDNSGAANELNISGSVATELALTTVQVAQDAQIKFGSTVGGGTPLTISSSTNKFDSVIEGVSLNLVSASEGETITLSLSRDATSAADKIQELVDTFNDTLSFINKTTAFNPDSKVRGILQSDSLIRTVASSLRDLIGSSVETGGNYKTLRSVGISLKDDGTLEFDADKFSTALKADYSSVENLFRQAETGYASRADKYLRTITMPIVGLVDRRQTNISDEITRTTDRIEEMNKRLEVRRQQLLETFTKMESAVSSFNTQGSYLSSQLAGINKNWA